ncbi:hypothetical protein DRJ22_03200 [Candidatus Woesearchaeota archaeon]|nr:MAG: hypothetical protein B6U93_00445 [Candidatus Woesearchaeota archaeon ex4484_78]RLE45943.1 MAG: hypothetical protein DRJ22_03200 [Candidatus Woesearchaeota archaeon]
MPEEELENIIYTKIKPLVEEAMQKNLGITISEIEEDISDKLKKAPLLDFEVDTKIPFKQAKKNFKKKYLTRLLQLNLGNVAEVARIAGIDRRSIHRLVSELKIDLSHFRKALVKREYIKESAIKDVLETSFETYKSALNPEKYEKLHKQVPLLSKEIIKELPIKQPSLRQAEKEFEKKYLTQALKENENNVASTAKKIGLRYETLHRKLKALGVI